MSASTESLTELYLEVTGEATIREPQQETPSHDPIGDSEAELERDVSIMAQENGLDDAVEQPPIEGG
jgi:hypothetical protein